MFKLLTRLKSIFLLSLIANISALSVANAGIFDNYAAGTAVWVANGSRHGPTKSDACTYNTSVLAPWNGKVQDIIYNADGEESNITCDRYLAAWAGGGQIPWYTAIRYCVVTTSAGWNDGVSFRYGDVGACARVANVCYASEPTEQKSGNPIDTATGNKVEYAPDWRSSKDSRFAFTRLYRSHGFQSGSQSTDAFGNIWASEWMAAVEGKTYGPNGANTDWHFHVGDGSILGFDANGTALQADHKYSLTLNNANYGGRKTIENGSGKIWVFKPAATTRGRESVEEVIWPDGYKITFIYDTASNPDGNILSMLDNRGQYAEFTWLTETFTDGGTFQLNSLTNLQIDTNYDGTNFNPEIELQYAYQAPDPVYKNIKFLETVHLVNISNSSSILNWKYEYDISDVGSSSKVLLTKIYDGRADAGGALIVKSIFGYDAEGRAISTEHTGNTDIHSITYNADGTVTTTNPLGKDTTLHFADVAGRNRATQVDGIASSNCLGTSKALDYTANAGGAEGYVYQRTERNGSITNYTRDARGLILTKTEDTTGLSPRVTTFQWHATLRLPTQRTTSQLQEDFTYTASGQLLTYTQTDVLVGSPDLGKTRTTTYVYTTLASGLEVLTSVDGPGLLVDGVTDIVTYEYDANGNLIKTTDANGLITEILTISAYGQPELVRQPDGIEWGFTYDDEGRVLTSVLNPNGATPKTTTYGYDIIGQLTSLTNTKGKIWTYTYDGAKRLTNITGPNGDEVNYTYDLMGNIINTAYSDGVNSATFSEALEYDELGRVMRSVGTQGQIWNTTYDVEDNLATITDPASNTVTNGYDALNRVVDVLDRAAGTTLTEYDDNDQVTRYTDPRSIDTTTTYNGFGDILTEASADRGTMSYIYNNRGLVTSMLDARSIVSTYEYDNGGRLTARRFPATPAEDVTFVYDYVNGANVVGRGKIRKVTDQTGYTETTYDQAKGTPVSQDQMITGGQTYNVAFDYDEEGNLAWIEYPSKRRIEYSYNDANEVTQVRHRINILDGGGNYPAWENITTGMTYLPTGPMAGMTYGDGAVLSNSFDTSYRLAAVTDINGAVTNYHKTYGYDTRDDLTSITDVLNSAQDEAFTHTPRQFLDTATGAYGAQDYDYDAVGNRSSFEVVHNALLTLDTYSYPAGSNRLSQVAEGGGHTRTFTYDAAGNTTYDQRTATDGYGYTYNAANRMETITKNGVVLAEYKYNAQGQQVVRQLNGQGITIHAVYDLDGNRIAEYNAVTSTLLAEYVWLSGQPIAAVSGGVTYYVRSDHIGRPAFATDATGAVVWDAGYKPFGEVDASTGVPMNLRFPGQWFSTESDLNQNWMRDYDPTLGRYIQADPLGLVDGASVYGYARQAPNRYVDPRGEFVCGGVCLAAAGAAIFAAGNYAYQLWNNDGRTECVNLLRVAKWGLGGAALGAALPALAGTAAGAAGYGGLAVNGMLHSSRAGLSTAFRNVSRQIARATGNVGSNHHWLIAQSSRLGRFLSKSRLGSRILNSRLLMNRINGRLNSRIGKNLFSRQNIFGGGVPKWVPLSGGAGLGVGLAGLGDYLTGEGCGCSE